MSTEPVRVRLEVTWWPETGDFSLARSVWSRPDGRDAWQMEGMEVSGSPVRLVSLPSRWALAADGALAFVTGLHREHTAAGPFPDL
jgi:hypothetical protein